LETYSLSPDRRAEAVFFARRQPNGTIRSAGQIELGLRREIVEELEQWLAELPSRQRGAAAWYPAEVTVIASVHGLPGEKRDHAETAPGARAEEASLTPLA
jgi:hypothetical protein